jgi:Arc/MetJ-type ribon-helix-helix transcriptional regulator
MTVDTIEQAYELARSGRFRSVSEIIRHLPSAERPALEASLERPGARRELILVCSAAWLARD